MRHFLVAILVLVTACLPASAGQRAIDIQTGVEELREVTYQIRVGRASCSAVAYAPTALVTAAHCGDVGDEVRIFDDNQFVGTAKLVSVDDNADLAVLVRNDGGTFAKIVPVAQGNLPRDTPVVVVGYPLGLGEYAVYGYIQMLMIIDNRTESRGKDNKRPTRAPDAEFEAYGISANVSFGNSGGGAFVKIDGVWHLVGICSQAAFGFGALTTYLGFFVSTAEINAYLK